LQTIIILLQINYNFEEKFTRFKEPFHISQTFENFFNYIYDKRKTLLKQSDELLLNLLEDDITTDNI